MIAAMPMVAFALIKINIYHRDRLVALLEGSDLSRELASVRLRLFSLLSVLLYYSCP